MSRFRKLAWAASAIVIAHLIWLAVWPNARWGFLASQQFQFLAGVLAGIACWRASERSQQYPRMFWQFSAVTFGFWSIASLIDSSYDLLGNGLIDPPLWVALVIFLSTAPMFIAALMGGGKSEERVHWDVILDVAQLLILIVAVHIMLVAIPSMTQSVERGAVHRLILLAAWRGALALALTMRAAFSKSLAIRRLLAPVAAAMSLFAVASSVGNFADRFQIWNEVRWFDLAWTIPFALVAVAASLWRERGRVGVQSELTADSAPVFIIYLPALAIPVILLSLYSTIVFEQVVVGLTAMFVSVAFFTMRVLVAQRRQDQMLQQLANSERRYRRLFEDNMAAVYRSTPDGQITDCNQAFCDMFGYTKEEIANGSAARLYAGGKVEREATLRDLRTHGQQRSVQVAYRRKDGSLIHTLGHRAMVVDRDGMEMIEGTLIDMTQRRSLELQLQQSQKMESLGTMAGGVAHDFNNLLTVIGGYSAMQMANLDANDPNHEYATEIKAASDRAAGLTRQLLAFSRQQVMEERPVILNSLIRDFEKFLRRLVGEDVQLRTSFDLELGTVRTDPGQMEQVLMNLTSNARDAMPLGGTIRIETANVVLNERSLERNPIVVPGGYARLSVSDDGIGMEEATIAHIFEPFFTTKAVGKGTGLGLATTYGIVKQSRGYIEVQSSPGAGSRFDVYLPLIGRDGAGKSGDTRTAVARGTETILLVEDDVQLRSMSVTLLQSCGYNVLTADDPREIEKLCERHGERIDLLLTDVVMPHLSGSEVAKRVAAKVPAIKILFMSGYPTHSKLDRTALEASGSFLQKPFAPAVLAAKVREVLDQELTGQA
ncbi:PAS/PAC sensor hybrid histidine kinase [Candidatus Koribacter versatilis Ellin345]|uniref:histidine kinase n=2 Tax=Candidatus Korobacter versatilis TaxID=658062 RepID=Q1IT62_KORVE|nr:PAS/PAC sensor hybrid histidine kinase [Candidatus Koribacter versatilis Ellin345]